MPKLLMSFLLVLVTLLSRSQSREQQEKIPLDSSEINFEIVPRGGVFYERPGAYSMLIKHFSPVVRPGDTVSFQVFFSGYGDIPVGKVVLTTPAEIFDSTSYVQMDMDVRDTILLKDGKMVKDFNIAWGKNTVPVWSNVLYIGLKGMRPDNAGPQWGPTTQFFDVSTEHDPMRQLSTERTSNRYGRDGVRDKAPLNFYFKTRPGIRPGNYSIDLVFTYYNGAYWRTDSKRVDFKVQNYFERNERLITWFGYGITLFGAVFTLTRIIDWVRNFFKRDVAKDNDIKGLTRGLAGLRRTLRTRAAGRRRRLM